MHGGRGPGRPAALQDGSLAGPRNAPNIMGYALFQIGTVHLPYGLRQWLRLRRHLLRLWLSHGCACVLQAATVCPQKRPGRLPLLFLMPRRSRWGFQRGLLILWLHSQPTRLGLRHRSSPPPRRRQRRGQSLYIGWSLYTHPQRMLPMLPRCSTLRRR